MKKPFYDKLEDVPQSDRDENNYELNSHAGSPHFGKYVLIIDQTHPVMVKNGELLGKEATRETEKTSAVNAATAPLNTQIQTLQQQLQTAQAQSVIPAGHIAVPADSLTLLNNFKALGELADVQAKVAEHGKLKEQTEATARKTLFSEVAKAEGFDEEVFADLAEETGLFPNIEVKKTTDAKGVTTTDYFVKGKDDKGSEISTAMKVFVTTEPKFKKFEKSLFAAESDPKKKLPIPRQTHGDPPAAKSGSNNYLNKTYGKHIKTDDAKSE